MSGYVVSPRADEDILEIWRYLCERASIEVANRVEAEIYGVFGTSCSTMRVASNLAAA
jgi:plasmid stabilization system protein ParE